MWLAEHSHRKEVAMRARVILGWMLLSLVLVPRAATADRPAARAGSKCNALVGDAPAITSTNSPAQVPTPAGGTLSDGTYVLTSTTIYTALPFPGMKLRSVMQITGNTIQQVATMNGDEKRFTTSFTTAGSSIVMTDTCPARKTGTYTFTATPTELRMYLTSPMGKIEQTYTKR
jgi:hypothetical protein